MKNKASITLSKIVALCRSENAVGGISVVAASKRKAPLKKIWDTCVSKPTLPLMEQCSCRVGLVYAVKNYGIVPSTATLTHRYYRGLVRVQPPLATGFLVGTLDPITCKPKWEKDVCSSL